MKKLTLVDAYSPSMHRRYSIFVPLRADEYGSPIFDDVFWTRWQMIEEKYGMELVPASTIARPKRFRWREVADVKCKCGKALAAVAAVKLRDGQIVPCTMSTLVGYTSPDGHDHDDNCVTRTYFCEDGHRMHLAIRRRCSACDWVGEADCDCHDGVKLDAWPEVDEMKLPV